jgi:hypothetical protein
VEHVVLAQRTSVHVSQPIAVALKHLRHYEGAKVWELHLRSLGLGWAEDEHAIAHLKGGSRTVLVGAIGSPLKLALIEFGLSRPPRPMRARQALLHLLDGRGGGVRR